MDDGIISVATALLDGAALDARIRHQEMEIQRYREALQKIAAADVHTCRPDETVFEFLRRVAREALGSAK